MGVTSLNTGLRTVDVARRVGCSVQHVRNLERAGALPPAVRSASGYRSYGQVHVRCAAAHQHLAIAVGPAAAKTLLRAALSPPAERTIALIDAAHVGLHVQRRDLDLAREAVAAIATEPDAPARAGDAMTISQLAGALDVAPSTLRHWQVEHLLDPERDGCGTTPREITATGRPPEAHQAAGGPAGPVSARRQPQDGADYNPFVPNPFTRRYHISVPAGRSSSHGGVVATLPLRM